jgi:hypothetical protein
MSIMNRARTSAGGSLELSKSTVLGVSGRVAALPAETRDLTRGAATLARGQFYATLGAGDAIVASIIRQRTELPAQAKHTAAKLAQTTKTRVTLATDLAVRAQDKIASSAGELAGRSVDVVSSVRNVTPAGTAKDAYAKLTVRGKQVAADLRHDPVLVRVIRDADTRVENAANGVTSMAQKVRARALAQAKRESAAASSTPVRITPANKVPAHRTTVRKTPAAEAPISSTPTYRAAAYETATRRAAAEKAAATRKAAAEQAAATRKAAAKKAAATKRAAAAEAVAKREATAQKAAATKKKNATAKDLAANTRHAAAVKAAATRKKNASA